LLGKRVALYIISEKNSKAAFRGKVYRLQEKIPSWLPSGKRRIDSEKRKKKSKLASIRYYFTEYSYYTKEQTYQLVSRF